MFVMFANDHHGDGRVALWLNAPEGVPEMLVGADPAGFFVPPYQGPFGWIGVCVDLDPDWDEVREPLKKCIGRRRRSRRPDDRKSAPS